MQIPPFSCTKCYSLAELASKLPNCSSLSILGYGGQLVNAKVIVARAMQGRAAMFSCNPGCGVDPRNLAQRIMEVNKPF